jgi:hypothetical protein
MNTSTGLKRIRNNQISAWQVACEKSTTTLVISTGRPSACRVGQINYQYLGG